MRIDRLADGSVRQAGTALLAGSALCLDKAVRNVIGWKLATVDEAIAMASANPLSVLAPALAAHGIIPEISQVEWSADLRHWTGIPVNANGGGAVSIVENDSGPDRIEVALPGSAGPGGVFVRLRASLR